jgi:predicted amidohydrolase
MPKINISLAQMPIVVGDLAQNTTTVHTMLREAMQRRSHLVLLPELWRTGYDWENYQHTAEQLNSGIFTEMSQLAQQHQVSIIGSYFEKHGHGTANSAVYFANDGRVMGGYRKMHLIPAMQEDRYLQPGNTPLTLDLPWGPTSVAICYDIRFPELFRRYVNSGAVMVLVVAQWPLERIEHWRLLLQARAIENQVYVIAVNGAGQSGQVMLGGHSMIVDPWGQIIIEAGTEPNLVTAEIELNRVSDIRTQFPVLKHRRTDVFPNQL